MDSRVDWSFEDEAKLDVHLGMTTPFPSLNPARFNLSHHTQWHHAHGSRTHLAMQIEQLNYTIVLAGTVNSARSNR